MPQGRTGDKPGLQVDGVRGCGVSESPTTWTQQPVPACVGCWPTHAVSSRQQQGAPRGWESGRVLPALKAREPGSPLP